MTIGATDVFLLVIIVSSILVGFFWGAVRSVLLLAAWLLAFFAGAYIRDQGGAYLASEWPEYPPAFSEMAAFGLIYLGLLIAAPILIFVFTKGGQHLTRYQVLDDLTGALFAGLVAVLSVAGLIMVLATFYGPGPVVEPLGAPEWTSNFYQSLLNSNIGGNISEHVVPIVETVLGPFLPSDMTETFA